MKYIVTECYQTNHQNVKMLRIVQKQNSLQLTCTWAVTTWRRKESSWGEERYHLIVFENWHYVDFLTMTSREIRFYLKISCPVSFFHCFLFPSQYQQYRLCLPSPSCQFSTYFPSLNCLIVYIDTVGDSRVGTCQHRRDEYHALISTLFISA